jgi:hypothetical protein
MSRSIPIRAPLSLARIPRSNSWVSAKGASSALVACMTPTVRPMIDTGTHTA